MKTALNAVGKVSDIADALNPFKVFWLTICSDGSLKISAKDIIGTHLEITPVSKVRTDLADGEKTICLPFAEFNDFINNMKVPEIGLFTDDTKAVCGVKNRSSKYTFKLPLINLPAKPNVDLNVKDYIEIESTVFIAALKSTAFSTHPAQTEAPLTGVKLEILEDKLICCSTDRTRATVFIYEFDEKQTNLTSFFINRTTIDKICNMPFGEKIKIYVDDTRLIVEGEDNFVYYGLQEVNGINYPPVLPVFNKNVLVWSTVEKDRLREALALSKLFDKDAVIKMTFETDQLSIISTDQLGDTTDSFAYSDFKNNNDIVNSVSIKSKRLIDAISMVGSSDVILCLLESGKDPFLLVEEVPMIDSTTWKHLILPFSSQ
jgi:DNA polymerase III sliding clamp (beta) subunit (PCNA family)